MKRHEVKKGELYLKIGKYRKMNGKKEAKTSVPATGKEIAGKISDDILADFDRNYTTSITAYFNDDDSFVRKAAYIAVGNIVRADDTKLKHVRREICHGIELRGRTHPQDEIVDVHERYQDFATLSQKVVKEIIRKEFRRK